MKQIVIVRFLTPDHLAQVVAGAEHRPRRGEDDDARLAVLADVPQRLVEARQQGVREGVAFGGAVERQADDGAGLYQQVVGGGGGGHGGTPRGAFSACQLHLTRRVDSVKGNAGGALSAVRTSAEAR